MASRSRPRRPRPALDVRLPAAPASLLPRLDALLDDFDPFAITDAPATGNASATDDDAGGATAAPGERRTEPLARRVYFFSAGARDAACSAIAHRLEPDGARAAPVDVADDGWAERAHADIGAVRVGDLVVAPPWDAPPAGGDSPAVVVIEPSMGFGTGHHASTRLCLRALQRVRDRLRAARLTLDLGAGSGVLAIAAARLGARQVIALERDPDAAANARDNVRRNGVEGAVSVVEGDLADAGPETGAVVTANLSGAFFVKQRAAVLRAVAAGGVLLASGVTGGEEPSVRAALEPPFTLRERTAEDEWVGFVLHRPGPRAGRSPAA